MANERSSFGLESSPIITLNPIQSIKLKLEEPTFLQHDIERYYSKTSSYLAGTTLTGTVTCTVDQSLLHKFCCYSSVDNIDVKNTCVTLSSWLSSPTTQIDVRLYGQEETVVKYEVEVPPPPPPSTRLPPRTLYDDDTVCTAEESSSEDEGGNRNNINNNRRQHQPPVVQEQKYYENRYDKGTYKVVDTSKTLHVFDSTNTININDNFDSTTQKGTLDEKHSKVDIDDDSTSIDSSESDNSDAPYSKSHIRVYDFPFSLKLPKDLPSSIPKHGTDSNCQLFYTIEATATAIKDIYGYDYDDDNDHKTEFSKAQQGIVIVAVSPGSAVDTVIRHNEPVGDSAIDKIFTSLDTMYSSLTNYNGDNGVLEISRMIRERLPDRGETNGYFVSAPRQFILRDCCCQKRGELWMQFRTSLVQSANGQTTARDGASIEHGDRIKVEIRASNYSTVRFCRMEACLKQVVEWKTSNGRESNHHSYLGEVSDSGIGSYGELDRLRVKFGSPLEHKPWRYIGSFSIPKTSFDTYNSPSGGGLIKVRHYLNVKMITSENFMMNCKLSEQMKSYHPGCSPNSDYISGGIEGNSCSINNILRMNHQADKKRMVVVRQANPPEQDERENKNKKKKKWRRRLSNLKNGLNPRHGFLRRRRHRQRQDQNNQINEGVWMEQNSQLVDT